MDIQVLVKNYCEASGGQITPDKAGQFDLVIDSDYRICIRPDQHNYALFVGTAANENLSPESFSSTTLEGILKRNVALLRKRKDFLFYDSKLNEIKLAYRIYLENLSKTGFTIELNRFINRLKDWMLSIESAGGNRVPTPMIGFDSSFIARSVRDT